MDQERDQATGSSQAQNAEVEAAPAPRFALLSWLFGERFDIELPAFLVSMTIHGLLLVSLAFAGYTVHRHAESEFTARMPDETILSDSTYQDIDQAVDAPSNTPQAGSFAPELASTISSAPSTTAAVPVTSKDPSSGSSVDLVKLDVQRATEIVAPTARLLGQAVSIQGEGAEFVGGVEGAVDRISIEIMRRLEQGRTLVVWAFDASGSLKAERERLVKHIDTVYTHIARMDESQLTANNGLLTMVVAFGKDRKALLPRPTADKTEILAAIGKVPLDETGIESTFTTVGEIARNWGRHRDASNQFYHTMVIVVTDEVGDDEARLEEAIAIAQKTKTSVYVLGSQALFGRTEGFVDYVDPRTKYVFHNLPVRQGPESVALEMIHLPFWYGGPQYEIVESGFGPWALSRLATATGGVYFVTRFDKQRMGFDPARMREYKPDWFSRAEYERRLEKSPLRQAILHAALVTQQKLPGMPPLGFPPAAEQAFKDAMANGQSLAERTVYTVDEALGPINATAKLRDRESSRRWQAHYDLIRGRLLAMKVRCYEYNWACARMKKNPPKFKNAKSNAWRLAPDTAIQYSEKAASVAREAESLLKRVVDEHPTTPWALLAERELKNPLGFKWVETYVPPPRRQQDAAQAKMKKAPPAKPPMLPKL